MQRKSFTMMELLVVIIVIGILSTLGISHYGSFRERTLDREAQANLRLIVAGEKIYRMENSTQSYYASANITDINFNLKLLLNSGASRVWDYATTGNNTACCGRAVRFNGPDSRSWRLRCAEADPVANGACP
ncbi:MAG: type II secretion system protein [Candidatus Omnitrophota bacterium]